MQLHLLSLLVQELDQQTDLLLSLSRRRKTRIVKRLLLFSQMRTKRLSPPSLQREGYPLSLQDPESSLLHQSFSLKLETYPRTLSKTTTNLLRPSSNRQVTRLLTRCLSIMPPLNLPQPNPIRRRRLRRKGNRPKKRRVRMIHCSGRRSTSPFKSRTIAQARLQHLRTAPRLL